MIRYIYLATLLAILLLSGCSGGTEITNAWSDKAVTPVKFKKIAIVGVSSRAEGRKAVELAMETKMGEKGITAIPALDFLPPNATKDNISREIFFEFLNSEKFDAVFVVTILAREKQATSSMGVSVWAPQYNVPLTDYYGQMSGYVYEPLYYSTTDVIFLECALYSFPEGKMIWAAQSKTIPLANLEQTASDYAGVLVRDLMKKKVLVVD